MRKATKLACEDCGHKFKKVVKDTSVEIACPKCGSFDIYFPDVHDKPRRL
jgi:predicted RNA-binding Zn-ribbon protein involved in translation (DUF1610 family)